MVKESKTMRNYDDDGFKKRAACVCVKNENENEVLLISSSGKKNNWIVPGGGIEIDEDPEDAAAREVYEEAGVKGRIGRFLGVFESISRKNRTSVYILIVDKEYEDWEEHKNLGRQRKWFSLTDAKYELEKYKPVQGTYINLLKGYDPKSQEINRNENNNNNNNNNENDSHKINKITEKSEVITTNDLNIRMNNEHTDNNDSEIKNLTHQYSLISSLNKPYIHHHYHFTYNSSNASSHLDHDLLSNTNTTSLLNTNTT